MLTIQGCAKSVTGVTCKTLKIKINNKYVSLYTYLKHLKNANIFPEKEFDKFDQNMVVPDPA